MSTATIPALPAPYRAARRFSALELRIERGRRFATRTEGEEAPSNKNRPRIARNPLKKLISDERIQGIPNKSYRPKPGNSRSPALSPRRPEEIQMSRVRGDETAKDPATRRPQAAAIYLIVMATETCEVPFPMLPWPVTENTKLSGPLYPGCEV